MLAAFDWLKPRRRRTDSAPRAQRIEPTLPDPLAPSSGTIRCRVRYNADFAVALTEQEAMQYASGTGPAWSDVRGDAPSREITVDVPVPRFDEPAAEPIVAAAVPIPPRPDVDDAPPCVDVAPTPVSDASALMQPTPPPADVASFRASAPMLSPVEHAERLLAWCRRRGLVGQVIIFDMERAYAAMCAEEGIQPRAWNPVSCELNFLLTGERGKRKSYATLPGGQRRRVFRIPAQQPVQPRAHELERAA